jgi:supervillin
MQTALDYWQSQHENKQSPVAYLAWAGLEPLQFTNLFPIWTDRDDIAEFNIRVGILFQRYKIIGPLFHFTEVD